MDVVGVEAIEGDWVKVAGKRKGGTWIDKGYVKKDNLTYDEKDIAVAVFGAKALAVTDRAKRDAEINKIVANKDLEGSVFINDLRSALTPVITETNDAVPATVDSAAVPAQ